MAKDPKSWLNPRTYHAKPTRPEKPKNYKPLWSRVKNPTKKCEKILNFACRIFDPFLTDTLSDFNHFKSVEKRLHDRNLLRDHTETYFRDDLKPFDKTHFYDHYPFYSKMVPVLHFVDDSMKETPLNRAVLDEATIENLNIILCLFIAEYLCHH